jgi:hypothetical protein
MRMSHLYKEMLTVQVLFLGAHHFMSGGFADRSRYSRACYAVLSGGDPVGERLPRHLLRSRLPPPFLQERGDGPALSRAPYPGSTQALPPPATRRSPLLRPHPGTTTRGQQRAKPCSSNMVQGPLGDLGAGSGLSIVTLSLFPTCSCSPPHPSAAPVSISTFPAIRSAGAGLTGARQGYSQDAAPTGRPPPRRRSVPSASPPASAQALATSLHVWELLQQWARPPSVTVGIIPALRHVMASPLLPRHLQTPTRPSARASSLAPKSAP